MRRRVSGAKGMVTAELAVLLPALVLLLVVSLRGLAAGVAELRCVDAARAAARSAARGDDASVARRAGLAVAPAGAVVTLTRTAGSARVHVTARVWLLPGLGLPLRASAEAPLESSGGSGDPP